MRTTNLIFAEHAKLSSQVLLLQNEVSNLERIDSIWMHADSVRRKQIEQYDQAIKQQEAKIKKVKKWSSFKDYIIGGLSILSICLLL